MRGGRRFWVGLIVVALLVGSLAIVLLGYARLPLPPARTPEAIPCPNLVRSSPQTLSTSTPIHILSPCPGIVGGSYLGGSDVDSASDVAADAEGNVYVTGSTASPDFPTTPGAYDTTFNGDVALLNTDAFLAKLDATGKLVFSTLLGGIDRDNGQAIALDPLGNIYIAGTTASPDFPTTHGAYDTIFHSSDSPMDAFLAKFDPDGSLVYSTLLGGSGYDVPSSVAVDPSGNAYVAGDTYSEDFPITHGTLANLGARPDAFVAKMNPEGTALVYSTVIGGEGSEEARALSLDAAENAYVTGLTHSRDFPVTPEAFDTTFNLQWPEEWGACCPYDGFLFKLNSDATALGYSTFIGGDSSFLGGDICNEQVSGIAADPLGIVYITGARGCLDAEDLPEPGNPFGSPPEGPGDFLARFEPSGMPIYEPFLFDAGLRGVALDDIGNVHLTGVAGESFPTTPGALDRTANGGIDAFVAKFDAQLSTLLYSSYLGGGDDVLFEPPPTGFGVYSDDQGAALAVDPTGNVTVVGITGSIDFPVPEGAHDPTYNGQWDAFVVRMELIQEPNRVPVAYIEASSENGLLVFASASNSADADDLNDLLEVRWDWDDDGVWDTEWSTAKTASHEYAVPGSYTIRLEVRDSGGLVGNTTREVEVKGGTASVQVVWIRQFGTRADDVARGIIADAAAVYVAGRTNGTLPGQMSAGDFDVFVRRYDPGGNEIWTRQFGSSGFDFLSGLAVDDSALYVTAQVAGTGGILRKYGLDGNEVWTRELGSAEFGVVVHVSGVYVGGAAYVALPNQTHQGSSDVFVQRYDSFGNELWTRQFGTPDYDGGGIVVDESGVYVVGVTFGALPGQSNQGETDRFVRKFDLDGNELWTRQFGTPGEDVGGGVALDESGLYVAGYTFGTFPDQASWGGTDAYVRKYDPNGNEVWTRQFGTLSHELEIGIAVDAVGVYVVGQTGGSFVGQPNYGGYDVFIRRYDAAGNELWTRQFGTPSDDNAEEILADASGVYVAGSAGVLLGQATSEAFVRKYSPNGDVVWTVQVGGALTGGMAKVAHGVYVAGATEGAFPGQTSAGGRDAFVVKFAEVATEEIAWVRQSPPEGAEGVAVDAEGNAYVVGSRLNVRITNACTTLFRGEDQGAFVIKYDADGKELWRRMFEISGVGASAVAVHSTGVYVTGATVEALNGTDYAGRVDAYVRRYDLYGNVVWTRVFGGPNFDAAYGIDVDDTGVYSAGGRCSEEVGSEDAFVTKLDFNGNLVWTQEFEIGLSDDSADDITVHSSGVYVAADWWVWKLNLDGRFGWGTRLEACARGVAIDASGVYVAGYLNGSCQMSWPTLGYLDAFLQKYDLNGNALWTRAFGTSANDSASAVSVDVTGVYVVGSTDGTLPDQVNSGSFDAFVRKYSFDGVEGWTIQFGSSSWDIGLDIDVGSFGVYTVGLTFVAKLIERGANTGPNLGAISIQPASAIVGQDVILAATTSDPDGDVLTYSWDFGDGRSAKGTTATGGDTITATHLYSEARTYTVTLSVDDGNGGVATDSATVRVVTPLSLDVSAEPIAGTVPLTVSFAGSPSGGVPPYSFEWDFGDGSSSTAQNPIHTYQVAGTYTVALDITDADDRTTTKTIQITASTTGPRVTGTEIPPWALYALVAAIAVGIGSVILRRWRKRVRTPPSPPGSS